MKRVQPWAPVVFTAAVLAIASGGAAWLWTRYTTILFFESIRMGFVACFG